MSISGRKKIMAGNWKMNKVRAEAKQLAAALASTLKNEKDLPEVIVCPPFTGLETVLSAVENSVIQVGAQNMDYRESGAFTGEISPLMLKDLGIKYVLIGHSERRQFFGETNASVNLKLKAAIKHGLIPIVCVGESLDERENNLTDAVVRRQIGAALAEIGEDEISTLIIAYEPIWAIGTGKHCEAVEANRVSALVRATVTDHFGGGENNIGEEVPVLYGGSVKPANVNELLAQSDVDGALVGGASLTVEDFLPLIKASQKQIQSFAKV